MSNPDHEHDWQPWDHAVTRDAIDVCSICYAVRSLRRLLPPRQVTP